MMTIEQLQQIILRNTVTGSPHQIASLEVLMGHVAQKYVAESVNITCADCSGKIECVRWSLNGAIMDTWGYIECGNGSNVCHRCFDESYIGDILMPTKQSGKAS